MGREYASATAHCLVKMRETCCELGSKRAQNYTQDLFKMFFDDYFLNVYLP